MIWLLFSLCLLFWYAVLTVRLLDCWIVCFYFILYSVSYILIPKWQPLGYKSNIRAILVNLQMFSTYIIQCLPFFICTWLLECRDIFWISSFVFITTTYIYTLTWFWLKLCSHCLSDYLPDLILLLVDFVTLLSTTHRSSVLLFMSILDLVWVYSNW